MAIKTPKNVKKPASKPKHGGKRTPGPGKKIGRPKGDGRVFESCSVSMHPVSWAKFDELCGSMSRGAFIVKKLNLPTGA